MEFSPLHPVFAAEAPAIDLSRPIDRATAGEIAAAMDRYAVLVFHGQDLTQDQQLDFTRNFGPLDPGRHLAVRQHRRVRPEFADVSNLDEEGRVADRNHRRILSNMATRLWHTDSSYKKPAAKFSLLYCSAVPEWGGETEFADMRAAYDSLPDRLREEAEGRSAEHYVHHSRATLGFAPSPEDIAGAIPAAAWPLVRTHAGSGRKLLYIGSHATHVVGLSVPEGRVLLQDLLEHATRRQFVYAHRWRPGDLVMWDNRAVLHRGRRYDLSEPRDMRRSTVEDALPEA
ncbi:MAG TPA: TauD/TfdA family dioxygenase [Stellaceae bacterium]|jgi:alpha-ketoglutarate-dependent 2,4-dichlorophenoxyacetate dioxygenase|nr:TauD/TfdA family dioxygenase [Stellaceae bacterium]